MRKLAAFLLLATAAAPAFAQDAPSDEARATEATEPNAEATDPDDAGEEDDDFDMAKMMEVFDKVFPAQPDPAPEKLALARVTAAGLLPDGTYAAMFEDLMSGVVDRVLSLSPADFGDDGEGEEESGASLREALAGKDPHFEERMRITRRVIGEELVKISALIEPRLREGVARSIARRFDEGQLRDINAFLATESGQAFGSQTMRMWMDPDVMRSMIQTFPEMFQAIPGAMQRLEAETAHLPKPPKDEEEEEEKDDEDAEEEEESVAEAEQPTA